jgi:hypothetical protein
LEEFQRCLKLVEDNNYRYLIGFEGTNIDDVKHKKTLDFSIVFYLNPNVLTLLNYTVYGNFKSLNCYIPYSFNIDNLIEYDYNNLALNQMFRIFALSKYHNDQYVKHSDVKGKNSFISGFPQLDRYYLPAKCNPWKTKTEKRKKVIWAPHWTLPGFQQTGLDWSCFLDYHKTVLNIADKYVNHIELALKPHPLLFNLLSKDEVWGKEKTEAYVNEWQRRENCQIYLGDYTDLFIHSDALIHDSGSFTVEYQCINKPVAYTVNNMNFLERFNQIGKQAIDMHHKIHSINDFEMFIEKVITGDDCFAKDKKYFVKDILKADGNSGVRIVKHLEELIS